MRNRKAVAILLMIVMIVTLIPGSAFGGLDALEKTEPCGLERNTWVEDFGGNGYWSCGIEGHEGSLEEGSICTTLVSLAVEDVTVTFMDGETLYDTQVVSEGAICIEPVPPTEYPEGMLSFKGWQEEGEEGLFDFGTEIEEDITLYAVYGSEYLVKFADADGKIIDSKEVEKGEKVSATSVTVVPPKGQIFDVWYKDGSAYDFESAVNENFTLYPHFEGMNSIYFVTNGTPVNPQGVKDGGLATEPADPTREGYTFSHWSLTAGGEAYDFATPVVNDITLYAVWTPGTVSYKVVYWLETKNQINPNLDDKTKYSFAFSTTKQATAGTSVTFTAETAATNNSAVKYGQFHHSDTKTILGTGTTVVNVYYSRIIYTLTFDLNQTNNNYNTYNHAAGMSIGGVTYTDTSTPYAINVKYEQDLTDIWPTDPNAVLFQTAMMNGGRWDDYPVSYSFVGWVPPDSVDDTTWVTRRLSLTDNMIPSRGTSYTIYASWSLNANDNKVNYWFEQLPGETGETATYNGKTYVKSTEYSQEFASTGNLSAKKIEGMTYKGNKNNDKAYNFFYDRNRHSLSFDTQGGSSISTIRNIMFGEDLEKREPNDPTKANKTFAGWYLDAEYDQAFTFAGTTMPNSDLELFAKWQGNDYKGIFYDKPAGEKIDETGVGDGEYLSESTVYEVGKFYEGLGVFIGWYWYLPGTNSLVEYPWEMPVHSDVTLYGQWKTDGLTVTYDINEGTGTVPVDSDTYDINVNTQVLAGTDLKKGNAAFAGWQLDGEGQVYYPGNLAKVTEDLTFMARYLDPSEQVEIIYHPNYQGATEPNVTNIAKKGDEVILQDEIFTRDRHSMIGWNTNPQENKVEYELSGKYTVNTDNTVHMYAIWEEETKYEVSYDLNGGAGITPESQVGYAGTTFEAATGEGLSREHYDFAGWNTAAGGDGTAYAAGDTVTIPANNDTVLYAQWTYKGVTVTFVAGTGGSLTGTLEQTVNSGTPWSGISVPVPTADDNYYFSGWTPAFPLTVTADATYTANFTEKTSIVYKANNGSFKYDGNNHTVSGVAIESGELKTDHALVNGSISAERTEKYVGTYDVNVTGTAIIHDQNGNDVTNQYNITTEKGTLTIAKGSIPITITANSGEFTYDGKDKTVTGYAITSGTLIDANHSLSGISAEKTEKNVGVYDVLVTGTAVIMDGKIDVTENYNITYEKGSLTITKAAINVTVTAISGTKTYTGADQSISGIKSVEGLLADHELELGSLTASGKGKAAGDYPVNVTGTAKITDKEGTDVTQNYNIIPVAGNLKISKAPLAVTVTGDSDKVIYNGLDQTVTGVTITSSGLIAGDVISGFDAAGTGKNVGTYDVVPTGKTVIKTAAGADVTANYDITEQLIKGKLEITNSAIEVTVTATSGALTYNGKVQTISGFEETGLLAGHKFKDLAAAGSGQNVSTYAVTFSGTNTIVDADGEDVTKNYVITKVPGTLTITKAAIPVTVTANSGEFTYMGIDRTVEGIKSIEGLLDGHKLKEGSLTASRTERNVGEYPVEVTGTAIIKDADGYNVTENYVIKEVDGKLTINKATIGLIFTANSGDFTYDGKDKTVAGYTVEGLIKGQTISGVTAKLTKKDVDTYDVKVVIGSDFKVMDGAVDVTENYVPSTKDGKLTIKAAEVRVTVTANSDKVIYSGKEQTVSGVTITSSGIVSDHAITGFNAGAKGTNVNVYDSEVTGTLAIMDGVADVTKNYKIVSLEKNDGTLTIDPKEVTVTVTGDSATKVYNNKMQTVTGVAITSSGLIAGDEISGFTAFGEGKNVGTYDVVPTGSAVIKTAAGAVVTGNYDITEKLVNGKLTITSAEFPITITATSGAVTYNGKEQTISGFDQVGLLAGHHLEGFTAVGSGRDASIYPVSLTLAYGFGIKDADGTDVTQNYSITIKKGYFTIDPATITVTAEDKSKRTNAADPTLTYTVAGEAAGEVAGFTGALTRDGGNDVGTYPITQGTLALTDNAAGNFKASNYTLVFKDGTLTITRRTSPGGGTVIEDQAPPLADLNFTDHFDYVKGYPEGDVRPENNITREEVTAIFYRLLADESRAELKTNMQSYSDVWATKWSVQEIATLSKGKIVEGYPDGSFRPQNAITRAEFAAIASRFDLLEALDENAFNDIEGHWASLYINSAAAKGWINGYEDGSFKPEQYITRAEAMKFINSVLDRGVDQEGLIEGYKVFPDNPKNKWYYYEVIEATNFHDYTKLDVRKEKWTLIKEDKVW